MWASEAPFCGPNTSAASVNRVRTSQAPNNSTPRYRAGDPMASTAPRPPSVEAEPPIPTMIRRAPCSTAWCINSPTPVVVASSGRFPSGPPASTRPAAWAISMTAVSPESRQPADTGSPRGPVTSLVRSEPPRTSSSPSPPSAIGTSTVVPPCPATAWATAEATWAAVAVPRNLSSAATTRTGQPQLDWMRRSEPRINTMSALATLSSALGGTAGPPGGIASRMSANSPKWSTMTLASATYSVR